MKNPKEIAATFGNQIRVRVCGILINQEGILLVNHSGLNESGDWWTPPGGGLIFGESLEEALIREFKEETGLVISVAEQLFIAPEMDETRFMVVGHGSVRPLIDNKTAENRSKNRRVEIIIVKSIGIDKDDEPEIDTENGDSPFEDQLNASPEDFELDPDEVF